MGFPMGFCAGGELPAVPRTLTVFREAQLPYAALACQVRVNGRVLGNIPSGGRLRTAVSGGRASVAVRSTSPGGGGGEVELHLKLGRNPRVSVRMTGAGELSLSVHDGTVLQRSSRRGPNPITGK